MRAFVVASSTLVAGCHLADDPEPPKCPAGSHVELDRCVKDEASARRVKISAPAGGTLCGGDPGSERPPILEPETLEVAAGEELQFENADTVAHEIRGTDGTAWLTVPAGELSPYTTITKVGTWGYRVSGCAKGGAVTVE